MFYTPPNPGHRTVYFTDLLVLRHYSPETDFRVLALVTPEDWAPHGSHGSPLLILVAASVYFIPGFTPSLCC